MKTISQTKSETETITRIVRCDKCNRPRRLFDVIAVDLEGEPSGIAIEFCKTCRVRSAISLLEVAA
jgi:hypothetical protein